MEFKELSDAQWERLSKVIPPLPRRIDNRGRPWNDPRYVLNGIIWVLANKRPWSSLNAEKYPPFQTCHRWYQRWLADGTLYKIAQLLEEDENLKTADWFKEGKIVVKKQRPRLNPPSRINRNFDISQDSYKIAA